MLKQLVNFPHTTPHTVRIIPSQMQIIHRPIAHPVGQSWIAGSCGWCLPRAPILMSRRASPRSSDSSSNHSEIVSPYISKRLNWSSSCGGAGKVTMIMDQWVGELLLEVGIYIYRFGSSYSGLELQFKCVHVEFRHFSKLSFYKFHAPNEHEIKIFDES